MWPKYIPMHTHGGFLFGGFAPGDLWDDFWGPRAEIYYKSQLEVGGQYNYIVNYYRKVEYKGKTYTVWLDRNANGKFTINPYQKGIYQLAEAMIESHDYDPRYIWKLNENGELVKKWTTFCNQFAHDLYLLLGVDLPNYIREDGTEGDPYLADLYYKHYKSEGVSQNEASAGFMLIWSSEGSTQGSGHIGMYMGGDNFISYGANPENPGSIKETSSLFTLPPIFVPIYFEPSGVTIDPFGF